MTPSDKAALSEESAVVVLADALNQFAMSVETTAREHGWGNLFGAARQLREDIAELMPE